MVSFKTGRYSTYKAEVTGSIPVLPTTDFAGGRISGLSYEFRVKNQIASKPFNFLLWTQKFAMQIFAGVVVQLG